MAAPQLELAYGCWAELGHYNALCVLWGVVSCGVNWLSSPAPLLLPPPLAADSLTGCRRKSGWGCYGPPEGTLHGARIILLRRGESTSASETWVRQRDGSRHNQSLTPAAAKINTQQQTCISDGGLLGWVGWSTLAARRTVAGVVAGVALAAVAAGVVTLLRAGPLALKRRRLERELSSSISRSESEELLRPVLEASPKSV